MTFVCFYEIHFYPKFGIHEIVQFYEIFSIHLYLYLYTRRSGCYAPILLAPPEGWGPFGPVGALRALLGAFSPQ